MPYEFYFALKKPESPVKIAEIRNFHRAFYFSYTYKLNLHFKLRQGLDSSRVTSLNQTALLKADVGCANSAFDVNFIFAVAAVSIECGRSTINCNIADTVFNVELIIILAA